MTDHDALLRSIAEHPEEDTPRLMYADWLEENGRPERAEFVRVQVELGRLGLNHPERHAWVVRNVRFLRDYVPGWKAELPQFPGIEWGDFNRGLVEEVQAQTEAAVIRHAAGIFAEPGVHVLRLARLADGWSLAELPELARIRVLRMVSAQATDAALLALLASPHWGRVQVLDLHGNRADEAVDVIAGGRFPDLTELWLGSNPVGNDGGRNLARSPHLTSLRWLDLRGTLITDPAIRQSLVRRFGSGVKL
jgi:uncharacterized protein (TIGR02996 family)